MILPNEYSDGEYSDDILHKGGSSTKEPRKKGSFDLDKPYMYFISKNLESVVTEFDSDSSSFKGISSMKVYFESAKKPKTEIVNEFIESTQSVILICSRPSCFPNYKSSFLSEKPLIFAWNNINTLPLSEFATSVQSCYKPLYYNLRQHILFSFFLCPNVEKIYSIKSSRAEYPRGRLMFHYIGYGYPDISNKGIDFITPKSSFILPFGELCDIIGQPSCYLFDCNNAGVAITEIVKFIKEKSLSDNIDLFMFCATSVGEVLPQNPRLPKDFLSSCLLSPISTAILCHIVKYYNITFPDPDFPMNQLNETLLLERSQDQEAFHSILTSLIDSIVSDFLDRPLFKKLFRSDRMISMLFQRFVLAQFLLAPYNVHPTSYPSLPSMAVHPFWQRWQSEVSMWITSLVPIRKPFGFDYYNHAVLSFENALETRNQIASHLVTAATHAPFSELFTGKRIFSLLANYISKGNTNYQIASKVIIFHSFFTKLFDMTLEEGEYHSLCYIVFALLRKDPSFIYDIRRELDVTKLPFLLFNPELSSQTRSLLAAICSILAEQMQSLESACSSKTFYESAKQQLLQPHSPYIEWVLIFLNRINSITSADPKLFVPTYIHIQISCFLIHPNPSCRASAVSALSSYISDQDITLSKQLFVITSVCLCDMSAIVRYELLLFIAKFAWIFQKQLIIERKESKSMLSYQSFDSVFTYIFQQSVSVSSLLSSFMKIAIFVEYTFLQDSNDSHIRNTIYFLISLLRQDSHESVKILADQVYRYLCQIELSQTESDYELRCPTSVALFEASLSRLEKTMKWDISSYTDSNSMVKNTPMAYTNEPYLMNNRIEIVENGYFALVEPQKIVFQVPRMSITVSTKDDQIILYDDELKRKKEYSFKSKISEMLSSEWSNIPVLAACSTSGKVTLINSESYEIVSSFSAHPSSKESKSQLMSLSNTRPRIATSIPNGGITLWDVQKEMLVSEASISNHNLSSMYISCIDDNLLYLGDDMGGFFSYDIRSSQIVFQELLKEKGSVFKIAGTRYGQKLVHFITDKGYLMTYDNRSTIEESKFVSPTPFDYTVHEIFPIQILSPESSPPVILTPQSELLWTLPDTLKKSSVASHPNLPVFACSSPYGMVTISQVAFSYKN